MTIYIIYSGHPNCGDSDEFLGYVSDEQEAKATVAELAAIGHLREDVYDYIGVEPFRAELVGELRAARAEQKRVADAIRHELIYGKSGEFK